MNLQPGRELVGKHTKKMQEHEEDPEQPLEHRHQIIRAASQDCTKSNSVLPLPVASCSDQEQDQDASFADGAAGSSSRENQVNAAHGGGGLPPRRYWWGDCQPHVVLLREALLSSAPDIAVLGPLHGCFSFYMTHLHNEVLSSTYARTMTLGANVTRLESAFMWVGGWRPTSAMVLIYSLMGIEIENALQAVHAGRAVGEVSTSTLLSARQLAVMNSLQKHVQNNEMRISKKLTLLQMLIGDQDVLEAVLLDAASPVADDSSRFRQVTDKRMSRFRRLLIQAEELRLHTLKDLLSLLTPIQAARCGVAVFEMCYSLRTMGRTILPIWPALPGSQSTALPAPSALLGKPMVQAGFVEEEDPDVSASKDILNSCGIPHSNNSSSQLLSQDSSRGFNREERGSLLSPIPQLVDLKLDNDTDGKGHDMHEKLPRVSPKTIISNRLLLLSPASSDVTIQSCSLESAELTTYFEMRPQLPLGSVEVEESSASGDIGGLCHLQPGVECDLLSGHSSTWMSAPCECAQQGSESNEDS